jgi:hypothetical protein
MTEWDQQDPWNSDQQDHDNSNDDGEKGWPAEDDNDKGPMGQHRGQVMRATATTTRGCSCPSCLFFIHFFFFFCFTKIYSIEIYYDINKDNDDKDRQR